MTALDQNRRERGGSTPCSASSREATATLPHEPPARHPDLFTAAEAAAYLRLDQCAPSEAAGRELLNRLAREPKDGGVVRIASFRWGKERLFHRSALDAFVSSELAASAIPADGKPCRE